MKQPMVLKLALLASSLAPAQAFWRMNCGPIQVSRIDPILSPGAVSGHVHLISGPINTNTTSDFHSLQAASCTSCSIQKDKSAYWTPQMYYQYANGSFTNVHNDGTVVYYLGRGKDRNATVPFPPGFRVLSGDSTRRSYDATTMTYGDANNPSRPIADRVSFNCINYTAPAPETPGIVNTNCPQGLRAQIHFPSCWDGVNVYLPGQAHVAYLSSIDNGVCPPTHPKLLPHLFYEVYYFPSTIDTSDGGKFMFSQGDETGYGFHGDFLNSWDQQVLSSAVDQCLYGNENGVIEDCAVLNASNDVFANTNCPEQPPVVDEQVKGILSQLPGCNTPSAGPASVPQVVCSAAFNTNSTGSSSDGQTREVPVPNVTTIVNGANAATYKGCYVEANGARALSGASLVDTAGMSTASCATFCAGKGFSLSGTEYAAECYCGNEISTAIAPQTECGLVCTGNRTEYCGGFSRLSVWNISAAPNPINNTTSASADLPSTTSPSAITTSSLPVVTNTNTAPPFTNSSSTSTSSTTTSSSLPLSTNTTTAASSTDPPTTTSSSTTSTASTTSEHLPTTSSASSTSTSTATSATSASTSSTTSISGTASIPTPSGATYLGCYSDSPSARSLTSRRLTNTTAMTVEICAQFAQVNNYLYFGLEFSSECYASNNIASSSSMLSASSCNKPCAGNTTSLCGGANALSLYRNDNFVPATNKKSVLATAGNGTLTAYVYQGCYTDSVSARTLGGQGSHAAFTNASLTVESCVQQCSTRGFAYAGMEHGSECFCNNVGITNGGQLAPGGDADCSMRCRGDLGEYCGASGRITVYARVVAGRKRRAVVFRG